MPEPSAVLAMIRRKPPSDGGDSQHVSQGPGWDQQPHSRVARTRLRVTGTLRTGSHWQPVWPAAWLSVDHWKWRTYRIGGDNIVAFTVVRCTPDRIWHCPQWILQNEKTCRSDYLVAIRTSSIDYEPID